MPKPGSHPTEHTAGSVKVAEWAVDVRNFPAAHRVSYVVTALVFNDLKELSLILSGYFLRKAHHNPKLSSSRVRITD